MHRPAYSLLATAAVLLGGCDALGLESADKLAAVREADGKAIGSACRHAGRAIEDCYLLNPKAQRAAVFAGWREMDEYMRENKLDAVAPTLARGVPPRAVAPVAARDADAESTEPAPTPKPAKHAKSHS